MDLSNNRSSSDKICYVCGDKGFSELIATCSQCRRACEHIYCMLNPPFEVPATWFCQECLAIARIAPTLVALLAVLSNACSS